MPSASPDSPWIIIITWVFVLCRRTVNNTSKGITFIQRRKWFYSFFFPWTKFSVWRNPGGPAFQQSTVLQLLYDVNRLNKRETASWSIYYWVGFLRVQTGLLGGVWNVAFGSRRITGIQKPAIRTSPVPHLKNTAVTFCVEARRAKCWKTGGVCR